MSQITSNIESIYNKEEEVPIEVKLSDFNEIGQLELVFSETFKSLIMLTQNSTLNEHSNSTLNLTSFGPQLFTINYISQLNTSK